MKLQTLLLVYRYFDDDEDKTRLWFETPNPLLGNMTPNEFADKDEGESLHKFVVKQLGGK